MTKPNDGAWLGAAGLERVFTSPGADVWRDPAALPRVYFARAVEHLPAAGVLARLGDPAVAASETALLENEEGTGATAAAGEARIVRSSDTEVVVSVDAEAAGTLVLLDAWSSDWRVRVDEQVVPIRHANWLARAVAIPAGRHEAVFSFVPLGFYGGLAISALTALGCLVAAVALRRTTFV
jgi:hypothetical protein